MGPRDVASTRDTTKDRERVRSTTASPIFLPYSVLPVVPLAEPSRKAADSGPGELILKGSAPWGRGRVSGLLKIDLSGTGVLLKKKGE